MYSPQTQGLKIPQSPASAVDTHSWASSLHTMQRARLVAPQLCRRVTARVLIVLSALKSRSGADNAVLLQVRGQTGGRRSDDL